MNPGRLPSEAPRTPGQDLALASTMSVGLRAWLAGLSDGDLRAVTDPATIERGLAYLAEQRVQQLSATSTGHGLRADVDGQRTYTVVIETQVQEDQVTSWRGLCSCPMVSDCKHVVAVLALGRRAARLAASGVRLGASGVGPGAAAVSEWERRLRAVVQEPSRPAPPLGLLVEAVRGTSRWEDGRLRVRCRPVTPGKRGGWIRTGVSWEDLGSPYSRTPVDESHRRLLRELLLAAQANHRVYGYGGMQHLGLADVGPDVWRLLRRAVDAGVPLLPGSGLRSVELADTLPADVRLDAVEDERSAVTLTPVIVRDGTTLTAAQVDWIGQPPSGFALLEGGPGPDEALTLVPLEQPLSPEVAALVDADPVRVPAPDVPRFAEEFLPALRRRVPVDSSSPRLRPARVDGPRLHVRVETDPVHRLTAELAYSYLVNGVGVSVATDLPLDQAWPGLPSRNAAGETALAARLGYLADAVGTAGPRLLAHCVLAGIDTARFVTQVLPRLQADPEVDVEVVGSLADYREAVEAPLVTLRVQDGVDQTRTDWFDLGVIVTIEGEEVPFTDLFAALAQGRTHLVLVSGTWFDLDRPELHTLRELIEEARTVQDAPGDGLQLTAVHAGLWEELVALGVVAEQSERWRQRTATLLQTVDAPVAEPPVGLTATLRPYQEKGMQWLAGLWQLGLGGILADDMGLGKTVQTLATLQWAKERGELTSPALIVCPTSVVATWAEQAARFCPGLRVATVTSSAARRVTALADIAADTDVLVTSYTLFRLEAAAYQGLSWAATVLDEAQTVKNHRSKTYAEIRRLRAGFRLAITGTPLENSVMDLWSLLSLTAPGLYPDPDRFAEEYRRPIEVAGDRERLERLRRRVRPLMLRRRKEDVAPELPAKQEQVLHVTLSPAHRRVYSRHLQLERQRVLGMLDDVNRHRMAIFRALTTLRQLSLAPELVDPDGAAAGSSKLDVLLEHLVEVAAEGHRALVFSQFTGFLALLRRRLDTAGLGYAYLDGRTRNRPAVIDGFRSSADPFFLISLKAGGVGLTLTEADYVFILDPWWNPAAEEQAIDRTHRIGQDKTVMVYRLVALDTVEEKVVALQERKRRLFADVVDSGGDGFGGALTADDIRAILEP